MNATSWKPPTSGVPAEDLALWNAAMSHMGAPLALGATGSVLRLSPISAPDLHGACAAVTLQTGGTAFFHLDAYPFEAMLDVGFDIADLHALAGPLHDAIYEGALQTLLDAVPQDLSRDLNFAHIVPIDAMETRVKANELVWFAAVLEGLCPDPAFFSVGVSAGDLCAFLKPQVINPRSAFPGLKAQIETRVLRFLGGAHLASAQVRGLEIGDLIVLDPAEPQELALMNGRDLYLFEQAEAGWQCTAVRPLFSHVRNFPMDEPIAESAQAEATETPQIADIAQTLLTFDLGEISVSLAELEQYQVGAIVPLPDAALSDGAVEVSVRVAGNRIAAGDLVQIDDRIAVRLNRILIGT